MDKHLGIGVYGNRGEWLLKLNNSLDETKQASKIWFHLLKTGIEKGLSSITSRPLFILQKMISYINLC